MSSTSSAESRRAGSSRLQQTIDQAMADCDAKVQVRKKHQQDYNYLKERLETLPNALSYDVMVPFGSVAFMPGKLVKTNQALVLLGDNWFAERSCHQTCAIIQRRLSHLSSQLKELEAERELYSSRLKYNNVLDKADGADAEGTVEIKEQIEIDQDQDPHPSRWVSRVTEEEQQNHKETDVKETHRTVDPEEFAALMRRLDQLEDEENQDTDESSMDSDDLSEPQTTATDTKTVTFAHTNPGDSCSSSKKEPKLIVNSEQQPAAHKSILRSKEPTPVDRDALARSESPVRTIVPVSAEVFTGLVKEASDRVKEPAEPPGRRPVSRFRQKRLAEGNNNGQ